MNPFAVIFFAHAHGFNHFQVAEHPSVDGFAFLTTEPNATVAPIHPKAMPVILTTNEEFDIWLREPTAEAMALQRPLPDGKLQTIAQRSRQDGVAE